MGLLDKAKFWKKQDEGMGDLSDLGDFGLDDKPGGGSNDFGGGLGDELGLPPLSEPDRPGMQPGVPTHIEEVHPTAGSQQMGDPFGFKPAQQQSSQQQAQPRVYSSQPPQQMQQYPQQPAQAQQVPQYAQQPAQFQQQAPQFMQHFQPGPEMSELGKDIEIIHAKLDAIKSSLDSINQRLATLERIASGDTGRQKYSW
jgi:hypothetical protein